MSNTAADQSTRGRRRDFERNRAAILAAANECFSEHGLGLPIEAIAKRAGVSPVTVYRRFPSRDDLERAVLDMRFGEYAETIEQAQASDDGRAAFRQTVHSIVAMQSRDRAFRDLIAGDSERLSASPGLTRFVQAFFATLERARREQVIRKDVEDEDVMLLLIATERVARTASAHSEEALRRLVDIMLDGICGEPSTLAGSALSWSQLLDATRE